MTDRYGRTGIVQVTNLTDQKGEVQIIAYDEDGTRLGTRVFTVEPNHVLSIDSTQLEELGDEGIGLSKEGYSRLVVTANVAVQILSYVEHYGGFLSSAHDIAPQEESVHRVYRFAPAESWPLESLLRLINPNDRKVNVTIAGVDESGESAPDGNLTLEIPAQATETYTGRSLEATLGDGAGSWQLDITADEPIFVMHLHQAPSGMISNLSTDPQQTPMSAVEEPEPPTPPTNPTPGAPTITFTGPREFVVSFNLNAEAGKTYAVDVQGRFEGEG
ncbi:MAG: hypothetical protein OXG05_10640 [Gammaproteobacteria bacterium]|nr:hypothetical protein [Gammaproteobacteria bacterium]